MIDSSKFIFHSQLFPFAIPYILTDTLNSTTSVTASQTKTIYGNWQDIRGTQIGWQTIYKVDSESRVDWFEYPLKISGSTIQVRGRPGVEYSNNQVRALLVVENLTSSAQTFTAKDFNFSIFMYQLNNVE